MKFYILTLFPEMIENVLGTSIIGRAVDRGLISYEAINIRDFTLDKHKKVDDYPYGGGAGMVMQAQPIYDAWESAARRADGPVRTVYLTPQGETFSQAKAKELALEEKPIPEDMIRRALRKGTIENLLVPVTCGTSYRNKGVQKLLDAIVDFMPSPLDIPAIKGVNPDTDEEDERPADDNAPFSPWPLRL